MTTEPETTKQPKTKNPDEIPVSKLMFKGSVDLPNEQQVSRITTDKRSDRPRYEIHFLPRINKYRVKEFRPDGMAKPDEGPHLTFLVPGDWCVAVLEGAS